MFSPTLPGENQFNESCATRWSGEIFCVISLCFTLFVTRILVPEKYFFKFLFDLVLRVGFPAYYIYSFPSLNQFIAATFKKSILDPINVRRENASQVISNLTLRSAPPQIEINVWKYRNTNPISVESLYSGLTITFKKSGKRKRKCFWLWRDFFNSARLLTCVLAPLWPWEFFVASCQWHVRWAHEYCTKQGYRVHKTFRVAGRTDRSVLAHYPGWNGTKF